MVVRHGLFHFVRGLSGDRSERRRLAGAVVRLLRQRRRSFYVLSALLAFTPTFDHSKIQLWKVLARSCLLKNHFHLSPEFLCELAVAIRSTTAYFDATSALTNDRNGFLQRSPEYSQLRRLWIQQPPKRLFVFHHFDARGYLPISWRDAFLMLQDSGWQVVLSTSNLELATSTLLDQAGVQIVRRFNIGICLGAYRDLALLLHYTSPARSHISELVLCNDSTLLVQAPEVLLSQLEDLSSETNDSNKKAICGDGAPILSGFTDSTERHSYHLQSFFLHANRALLNHPAWLTFWLQYPIHGSKDDLINRGEIGLSQAMLVSGIELRPVFSLVQGLLTDQEMANEIQNYGIYNIEYVNQSLFAWRSLLARGFPLVKKHVLFRLEQNEGQPLTLSELARWIPQDRRELLAIDIQQLLISTHAGYFTRKG